MNGLKLWLTVIRKKECKIEQGEVGKNKIIDMKIHFVIISQKKRKNYMKKILNFFYKETFVLTV